MKGTAIFSSITNKTPLQCVQPDWYIFQIITASNAKPCTHMQPIFNIDVAVKVPMKRWICKEDFAFVEPKTRVIEHELLRYETHVIQAKIGQI